MMINVLDKWEVGGAWCRSGNTKPWPATPMRPRLKLDIPVFAKRINHYSSIISQFSSDTAESSVCNGQPCEEGWPRHQENGAKPPLMERTGWLLPRHVSVFKFSLIVSNTVWISSHSSLF